MEFLLLLLLQPLVPVQQVLKLAPLNLLLKMFLFLLLWLTLAATSRKRGGFPGRNKAKNGVKKEKLEEKKQAYIGKKEQMMGTWVSQMKEQTQAAQQQAATGGKLEKILNKVSN